MANHIVAAFDFDGTITRGDTLLPFLRSVVGRARFFSGMAKLSPVLIGFALRSIRNDVAKEAVLTHFLSGEVLETLQTEGERFASQQLRSLVRASAIDRLAWHQSRGHRCVLISASLDCYLEAWARDTGFDDLICSSLEVDDTGRVTGKLEGANCFGIEKVNRLRSLLGESWKSTELYAYGDSRGDKELLAAAQHSFFKAL